MTIGSCFSGIGGELVAASMLGWDVKFFCEKNPFGNRVLSYWYPNAKNYEDITTADFTEWRGRVDVLTGGFPCQPFSYAGRRRGAEDDRYLWPSMYRAIDEIQPTWVVAENVAGILTMVEQGEVSKVAGTATLFDAFDDLRGRFELRETFTLQRICTDLESHGYAVQPVLVPACAVGAPHRRDRVFIVARRIASDTDNRADGRAAREDEGKGREERIQERHEVRKPDEPNQVRPEGATIPQDSMHSRQLHGQDEVEGSERNIGNVGAGGSERICSGTSGTDIADTADARAESLRRRGQDTIHGSESVADTSHARLQGSHESRTEEGRMREYIRRVIAGHGVSDGAGRDIDTTESDYAGERWQNFPSVSPVHRGNDGLPFDVDRLTLSFGKWRTEALKAYGNAIVPQVMYEIFRAIEIVEQQNNEL